MSFTTTPVLRYAHKADIPGLSVFAQSTFIQAYQKQIDVKALSRFTMSHFSPEKMEKEMEMSNLFYLLLLTDSIITGYSKFFEQSFAIEGKVYDAYFIEKLYVHPELKGRGFGTLLLGEIFSLSERQGKNCLWLKVWEKNLKALSFYRKFGFQKAYEMSFQMEWLSFNDHILYKLV